MALPFHMLNTYNELLDIPSLLIPKGLFVELVADKSEVREWY